MFHGTPRTVVDTFDLPTQGSITNYDFYLNDEDSTYFLSISIHFLNDAIRKGAYTILPTPGTIPPSNASASFGIRVNENNFRGLRNNGGQLIILTASSEHITGRFNFIATDENPAQEVHLEGEFSTNLESGGQSSTVPG